MLIKRWRYTGESLPVISSREVDSFEGEFYHRILKPKDLLNSFSLLVAVIFYSFFFPSLHFISSVPGQPVNQWSLTGAVHDKLAGNILPLPWVMTSYLYIRVRAARWGRNETGESDRQVDKEDRCGLVSDTLAPLQDTSCQPAHKTHTLEFHVIFLLQRRHKVHFPVPQEPGVTQRRECH